MPLPLSEADDLASVLVLSMAPFCDRISVAGSVRRCKPQVKDIEIVCIPRVEPRPNPEDLFGGEVLCSCLYWDWAMKQDRQPPVQWIKPSNREGDAGNDTPIPWTVSEDGKYWRGFLPAAAGLASSDVKVDIFLTTAEQWGAIFLIRTGPWDFGKELMTHARRVGYRFEDGRLWQGSRVIPTPTEERVFELLSLRFVPPQERTGPASVRPIQSGR